MTALTSIKIGYLDERAHQNLLRVSKAIQTDSLTVIKSTGLTEGANDLLTSVNSAFDMINDTKDKYVRLSERYKHDKKKLLEITKDWRDFTVLLSDRFVTKDMSHSDFNQIQMEEIIKRFNLLLS